MGEIGGNKTRGIKSLNGDNYFSEKACELRAGIAQNMADHGTGLHVHNFACNCTILNRFTVSN